MLPDDAGLPTGPWFASSLFRPLTIFGFLLSSYSRQLPFETEYRPTDKDNQTGGLRVHKFLSVPLGFSEL